MEGKIVEVIHKVNGEVDWIVEYDGKRMRCCNVNLKSIDPYFSFDGSYSGNSESGLFEEVDE